MKLNRNGNTRITKHVNEQIEKVSGRYTQH